MWVSNQRAQRKQGLLRADRVARLDEINFVWDAIDTMWNRMFAALQNYKSEHGNCEAPQGWRQNPRLGRGSPDSDHYAGLANSAQSTRQNWRELDSPGRVPMLTCSGTRCSTTLLDYKRKYGNCNVPDKWPENRKLSGWVGTQRQFKKRGVLTPKRIKRLKEIGFDWNIRNAAWNKMFAELLSYQRRARPL